ncbi:MAG TPA: hypothetical protein VF305_04025, partial [Smithellaceae bacterium]
MRKILFILLLVFFCACGSSSNQIPQWKDTASTQLENYKKNFLMDKEDAIEPHFAKAKKAVAGSNDLNLFAIAYLTKYALHTAALEDFDDSEFIRIDKLQSIASNSAYYNFLKGNFAVVKDNLL